MSKHSRESVELTNMCMVSDADGRVLIQNHAGANWRGIAFPGGYVESGESLTDSVIREVHEETGLTIEHPRLCGASDWMNEDGSRYVVLCYKAEKWSGDIASSEEGEVRWIDVHELSKLKLSKGMRLSLHLFMEEELTERRGLNNGN